MKRLSLILSIVILAGCAGANYRPLVDSQGINMSRYETDLQDCQRYATQVAGAGESAVAGAVVGALFGAVIAAAAGRQYDRTATARVGAVSGAVGAGASGDQSQRDVIRRCMSGRGYRVLQ